MVDKDKQFVVIEPGHVYDALDTELSEEPGHINKTRIVFMRKEPIQPGATQLDITLEGTTTEAVLGILIDRVQFLQGLLPCEENKQVLQGLIKARDWLDKRTKNRQERGVEGSNTQ